MKKNNLMQMAVKERSGHTYQIRETLSQNFHKRQWSTSYDKRVNSAFERYNNYKYICT